MPGLSPLARGNLLVSYSLSLQPGPIPARAGEPLQRAITVYCLWAYPRSRGGTLGGTTQEICKGGLSPLARGNRSATNLAKASNGPIPARAGEPRVRSPAVMHSWAYPRSRGGTVAPNPAKAFDMGLSPLARGNHELIGRVVVVRGPIPARAGEPRGNHRALERRWAYPRSRGGTEAKLADEPVIVGLSPLARGNQMDEIDALNITGPIPARAGEPSSASHARRSSWAYPRSRGGT